jgi:UDP-glucose 4-epimerase
MTTAPRTLVTGGTGFIGRNVIAELVARDRPAMSLDHRAKPDHVRRLMDAGAELIVGDIRDPAAVEAAAQYCEAGIIHLAGVLGTGETVTHPRDALDVNITGALNVLETARRLDVPVVVICVGNHWMRNPYAISKRAAEELTNMAAVEWGIRALAVRALNAYGPDQAFRPVRKIIPTMVAGAVADHRITVYGTGEQRMDMIHVDDVAAGLVNALDLAVVLHQSDGTTLELGTGRAPTVLDIAQTIAGLVTEHQGHDVDIECVPMRPGEELDSTVVADKRLVSPLLDWSATTTIEDGLAETVPELIHRYTGETS